MKKLLLGIGTLSLTALPILAVVSCSTTSTTPTLDGELKKLTSKATLNPLVTAEDVNKELSIPGSSSFNNYYTPIKLSEGFTYVYTSSKVNATTPTTLDVILTVTQANPAASKTKTIQITGFATSTLDGELKKLTSKATLNPLVTVEDVNKELSIPGSSSFNNYYTPIKLSEGFTYVYTSSKVNATTPTTLDVILTVTQANPAASKTKTIQITGFATSTLKAEAALLTDKPSEIKIGTSYAAKTEIDNALITSPDAAKAEFEKYYLPIKLADGFSYAYTSSTASDTILVITVTITLSNGNKTDTTRKTITLSEFAPATTL